MAQYTKERDDFLIESDWTVDKVVGPMANPYFNPYDDNPHKLQKQIALVCLKSYKLVGQAEQHPNLLFAVNCDQDADQAERQFKRQLWWKFAGTKHGPSDLVTLDVQPEGWAPGKHNDWGNPTFMSVWCAMVPPYKCNIALQCYLGDKLIGWDMGEVREPEITDIVKKIELVGVNDKFVGPYAQKVAQIEQQARR